MEQAYKMHYLWTLEDFLKMLSILSMLSESEGSI